MLEVGRSMFDVSPSYPCPSAVNLLFPFDGIPAPWLINSRAQGVSSPSPNQPNSTGFLCANAMSLIDVFIPLIGGILLVACPQIFFQRTATATEEEIANKKDKLRKIGFVLLGVAALYFLLAMSRTPVTDV
jgi:hypothetical protein